MREMNPWCSLPTGVSTSFHTVSRPLTHQIRLHSLRYGSGRMRDVKTRSRPTLVKSPQKLNSRCGFGTVLGSPLLLKYYPSPIFCHTNSDSITNFFSTHLRLDDETCHYAKYIKHRERQAPDSDAELLGREALALVPGLQDPGEPLDGPEEPVGNVRLLLHLCRGWNT